MGSDDLHHKRKAKKGIARRKANRKPYDHVLIVCEDSQSTPSYLEALRDDLKLTNLEIEGKKCGSAPVSVVEYAKQLMKKKDAGYDRVYCVVDRDQHANFQEALQKAKGKNIDMIISIPCFEYWLLLHFAYIARPFQAAQGSHCEQVIRKLKKYWPDYEKGNNFLKKCYLDILKDKQEQAIEYAKKREHEYQDEELENKNPFTQFHYLIEYLIQLSQP